MVRQGPENQRGTHLDVLDDQIIQDQCVAVGADTEAFSGQVEGKSDRFGPLCARVSEGDDLTNYEGRFMYDLGCIHLVLETLDTGPSTQYKRIVRRDHGDDVDAFSFELVILLDIAR